MIRNDWGSILTMLSKDCKLLEREETARGRQRRGGREREDSDLDRKRRNALLQSTIQEFKKHPRVLKFNWKRYEEVPCIE